MEKYPNNVIPFPSTPKPVSAVDSLNNLPSDAVPFLAPSTSKPAIPVKYMKQNSYEFLTLEGIDDLELGQAELDEIEADAVILDEYLKVIASKLGNKATAKLAEVIEIYVSNAVDISFAQGLAEGALPDSDF